jgi:hypothetical protein
MPCHLVYGEGGVINDGTESTESEGRSRSRVLDLFDRS